MHHIVALSGFAFSGKDHLANEIITRDNSFQRYALADFLKELMCLILDMSIEELNEWKNVNKENRQRLIDFSEKGIKQVDKCFWVKKFKKDFDENPGNYIITDMRYFEEYFFLLKHFAPCEKVILKMVYVQNMFGKVYEGCGNQILSKHCGYAYRNYLREDSQHAEEFSKLMRYIYEPSSGLSSAEQS